MKNILILHGSYSDPDKNWFPYVKRKAEEIGFVVSVPQLAPIKELNIEKTYHFLLQKNLINPETVMVGHSSGATLILKILQKLSPTVIVKKAILVAGFIDANLTKTLFKEIPKSDFIHLFTEVWDWEKIKKNSRKFIVFQGSDDPYIQMRHAKTLKEKLDGELVLVPGGLHFSIGTGGERFKEFPEILKYIE